MADTDQTAFGVNLLKDGGLDGSISDTGTVIAQGKSKEPEGEKLNQVETYIAIIKGYSGLAMFLVPKFFVNGGWLFAPLCEIVSGVLTSVCVLKLCETGLHYGTFSYPDIVNKAFGNKARLITEFMIAITQFSFTIAHMGFIIGSLKSTVDDIWEIDSNPYMFAWLLMIILTPLACVRNIAKFSFTFLIGVLMILISFFVVSTLCFKEIYDSGHIGTGTQMFNSSNFSLAIGFSIFNFEGIGVVMPIMKRT
jgi:solute carrier family 36 (proton-coupled amino acid transporter)